MTSTEKEVFLLNSNSSGSSIPPAYELDSYAELSTTSSRSSSSPPQYDYHIETWGTSSSSSQPTFQCTKALQIEARGHPLIALPIPPRPVPIPVYNVDLASGTTTDLAYESLRSTRGSGNSLLVRAGDSEDNLVCRTTYRFGPGNPPKMELMGTVAHDEEFEVVSKGLTTRAQVIRTHLGTFQWRYAERGEKKEAGVGSLLVLDRIIMVAFEGGRQEEKRTPVARLVRSADVRSQGSKATTAGNGGRLMMNLREWEGTTGEAEQLEVLVVASCLVMLKKEIDRRRMHQAIAMTTPLW
ncbi:hypothetical protein TARUN_5368 [Trichoderma arundinaceum]|uniref:Uncharacterized protein n=1 Tax=Trichoderma arundinaceum TaxID=490622 RepID=A0A395NLA5_TRIAR|nr:hypothetical protein TARUN_5368 [Trichoderma arundinaceum]